MSNEEFQIPKTPVVSPALVKTIVTAAIAVGVSVAAQYGFDICPAQSCPPCAEASK